MSKGVPDLAISELRFPFDSMIPEGRAIDEALGIKLCEWAKGSAVPEPSPESAEAADQLRKEFAACDKGAEAAFMKVAKIDTLDKLPASDYAEARSWIARRRTRFNAPQPEQA